jgi:RNA polymerase sigma factor (sigma-70 family)
MTNGAPSPGPVTPDRAPAGLDDATDRQLLRRFVRERDEVAFAVLVKRYGPMVLGVCRRVLAHTEEAEDAFQATFLVLVRRAASITQPELLGNWLYGVAYRIARKARAQTARRAQQERPAPAMTMTDPLMETAWRELHATLDEELQQLPPKYRAPLVLCYLEGLSNKEAARRLGWPIGSISYRLARGRELLRGRLQSRHPNVPPALMAALPIWGAAPAADLLARLEGLVLKLRSAGSDAEAAAGTISPTVAAMAAGAIQAMTAERQKRTALVVVVLTLLLPALVAAWLAVAPAFASLMSPPPPPASCHP